MKAKSCRSNKAISLAALLLVFGLGISTSATLGFGSSSQSEEASGNAKRSKMSFKFYSQTIKGTQITFIRPYDANGKPMLSYGFRQDDPAEVWATAGASLSLDENVSEDDIALLKKAYSQYSYMVAIGTAGEKPFYVFTADSLPEED